MHSYLRPLRRAVVLMVLLGAASASILVHAGGSRAAGTPVSVYPIAGSKVAPPGTQITFRGVPTSSFGSISVVGSQSGAHGGRVLGDSDGKGGSFVPDKAFTPGETVTVRTNMNIVGASNGDFTFTVAVPAGKIPFRPFAPSPRVGGDVYHFHSYPQINPIAVTVDRQSSRTARGYIFVTPWYGPVQNGVMILDSQGKLVWFKAVPRYNMASDFRLQTYRGQTVMTWWQGYFGAGVGSGQDVIYDSAYHQVASVQAGNGLTADLHDFEITPRNTALIVAEEPVKWDASSIHKSKNAAIYNSVVQEIDIPTGLVLFQWDSLDHVPLNQSYTRFPRPGHPFDWFHLNSVEEDNDGNIVISGRSTSAIYRIERSRGHILWTLGGKHSSFKFARGAAPAFQHDAVLRHSDDSLLTVFDNGAGLYNAHKQSRALYLHLDPSKKSVSELGELDHAPSLLSTFGGSVQELQGGDAFVGWGSSRYFSEYNSRRQMIFDARFKDTNVSYRAYRFPFNGYPQTQPRVAASSGGRSTTIWVSWNGDTRAHKWRVLAGSSPSSLSTVKTVDRSGFETSIGVSRTSYVQVQALSSTGSVLSTSPVTKA
jgi:Arylsulfotransferase (ASST)